MSREITPKQYVKNLHKAVKQISKLPLHKLEKDVVFLKLAFDIAYEFELFALYSFEQKIQEKLKLKLFKMLTPISGNLAFLGIQILAANSIMNKNNFAKKEKYFHRKCGIAINHLRASKTVVEATACKGGYKLNGTLTWASGYKIFNHLLIGFHFEGREYEVMAKFKPSKGFYIDEAPQTFVGFGLNTVNIELKNFFVKDSNIVSSHPIGNYTKNKSLSKTIHYSFYGLGCGVVEHIKNPQLIKYLKTHLRIHKEAFVQSNNGQQLDKQRVELFNFLQKVITTAIIQNGGKSILEEQHLQQYYRELIMFNCNGLNQNIKNLFLQACFKH